MTRSHLHVVGQPKGNEGVALPVALFGLVAVSVLVTSALVTSSTELALSRAHQDGTRALYAADGALEQFVAQRAAMTSNIENRLAPGSYTVNGSGGEGFSVAVAELFRGDPIALPGGAFRRSETYSLVASPSSGRGRSVGALIEVSRLASAFSFNVDSGLTLGSDATVSGSATISDGSSAGAACDSASAAAAIRHADGTSVKKQGNGHDIYGAIVKDARSSQQLMAHVLNGHDLAELSQYATFRFGPMFGQPAFTDGVSQTATNPSYRWGCPAQLVTGCTAQQAAFYPTVVIDANGGTVDLTGTHGQGILVIRNGDIHIRGNFKFAGILLVEGTLRVTGTPRIEGGVIAMGDEAIIDPGDATTTSGNSLIRYNKCQIVEAQRGMTLASMNTAAQTIDTPTFAWFEVVR